MSKYTKLTKSDLEKVIAIQVHYNQVATDTNLYVSISEKNVSFSIHKNVGCDVVKSWHVVPACYIDKTIVEILQELVNN